MSLKYKNDIINISENAIEVCAHNPKGDGRKIRVLGRDVFQTWWEHLQINGTATTKPGDKNNPVSSHSAIVAAILVRCLPNRIKQKNSITIKLLR